ncbi:ATP-binding protein [Streptomyces sp. SAS_276]|uniref:ATP-binding protein n=1 Tax=Streptomyces sp. SAS_276 TaxID=3412745 RepID=UPI00403D286B
MSVESVPPAEGGAGTADSVPLVSIVRSLTTELPGDQTAVFGARVWIRIAVTALGWNGNVLRAAEAVSRLVDNGVRHGMPAEVPRNERLVSLEVALTDAGGLVIDVSDLEPAFPDFEAARRGEKGRGLWQVSHLGAQVTQLLPRSGTGKTVRAVLAPGPVDL